MKELPSRSIRFLKDKKKVAAGIAGAFLAAVSIAAGTVIVPSDFEIPVTLASGEVITPPWYITVEGKAVALVDSEEDARKAVQEAADHYKNDKTIDVQIEEQTSTRVMNLENGDEKPEILTVEEAASRITEEEDLTVRTTEVVTRQVPVAFKEITEKTDKLYTGETRIKQEGQTGLKAVTKKITKENGESVSEEVLQETLKEEPEPQIILVGTKEQDTATLSRGNTDRGSGKLASPLSSLRITSGFGPRWGRTHLGVDFGMNQGSPIFAAGSGTVVFTGYSGSYGNLVKIDHGEGLMTCYAHCSEITAVQGQTVKTGDTVAKVGSTGNSTGPHLHFEVRINGQNVDPMKYLK